MTGITDTIACLTSQPIWITLVDTQLGNPPTSQRIHLQLVKSWLVQTLSHEINNVIQMLYQSKPVDADVVPFATGSNATTGELDCLVKLFWRHARGTSREQFRGKGRSAGMDIVSGARPHVHGYGNEVFVSSGNYEKWRSVREQHSLHLRHGEG
jgi:hypothetical protein